MFLVYVNILRIYMFKLVCLFLLFLLRHHNIQINSKFRPINLNVFCQFNTDTKGFIFFLKRKLKTLFALLRKRLETLIKCGRTFKKQTNSAVCLSYAKSFFFRHDLREILFTSIINNNNYCLGNAFNQYLNQDCLVFL